MRSFWSRRWVGLGRPGGLGTLSRRSRAPQELVRGGPPRAMPECPRETSGASPERPWSAQRVQKSSGELKTALWVLKRLPPEASGPRFVKLSGLLLRHPQLVVLQCSPRAQDSRGRRSIAAGVVNPPPPGRRVKCCDKLLSKADRHLHFASNTRPAPSALPAQPGQL